MEINTDIAAMIKLSRESAILGMYEASINQYKTAQDHIEFGSNWSAMSTGVAQKWKDLLYLIKNELNIVIKIKEDLEKLQAKPGKPSSKPRESQDDARPFGNRGQASPTKPPVSTPNDYYKKPIPPPVRAEPILRQPLPQPQQVAPSGGQNKPNYNKPWLQNLPEKGANDKPLSKTPGLVKQPSNKAQAAQPSKPGDKPKTYLESLYPNGVGPDSDLIQMLERDLVDKSPNVKFDDIAGLQDCKKCLQEAVLLPILMPQYFIGIRRPWKGVLMFGPPGTGKTMLAKAVATSGGTTFFNVSASSLGSKYRGESEKLVRYLFEMARFYAPTTIFMDEIDALAGRRGGSDESEGSRRVKAELLVQMDGATSNSSAGANAQQEDKERGKNIMVLAATNRPQDLDDALRRRLEKRVYIPLPTSEGRSQLFNLNLRGISLSPEIDFNKLVEMSEGYSGADISNVCREAAMMPLRKKLLGGGGISVEKIQEIKNQAEVPLEMEDFLNSFKNIQKSVSKECLDDYAKWMAEFGSV